MAHVVSRKTSYDFRDDVVTLVIVIDDVDVRAIVTQDALLDLSSERTREPAMLMQIARRFETVLAGEVAARYRAGAVEADGSVHIVAIDLLGD